MDSNNVIMPGWETVRCIGSGSSGKVYELMKKDEYGGNFHSALKVISIPSSQQEYDEMQRTMSEYAMRAKLRDKVESISNEYRLMSVLKGHPNIVNCEDTMIVPHTEDIGWDIYIRMELLTSLPDYVHENGLTVSQVIKIGTDICSALELCIRNGIVHRDIKPQNIFVSKYGDYKLGDFGVAKEENIRGAADKVGTYAYMAPEVYKNKSYDESVDIYSLGMVLYWLLNDRRGPFLPLGEENPSSQQIADAQLRRYRGEALPAPKNGNTALKKVVLKACSYNPADRYSSPTEMKQALALAATGKFSQPAAAIDDEKTVCEEFTPASQSQASHPVSVPKQKPAAPKTAPVYKPQAPAPVPKEEDDDSRGGMTGLIIFLALLIVAVLAAITIYFGNSLNNHKDNGNSTPNHIVDTDSPEETTKISSIIVSSPQLTVTEGDTAELTVKFVPDLSSKEKEPPLVWRSSDDNIVSVDDDGEVEGVKAGTATVRVYLKSDMNIYSECVVTVEKPKLTKITVETMPDKMTYGVGDELDLTGLVVRAYYENDTVERITDTSELKADYNFNSLIPGPSTVTITYGDQSTTFDVQISWFE